jgi:hypothetical protein
MTSKEILEFEVALLLLKYGRKSILQALAGREQISEVEIQSELQALTLAQRNSKAKKKSSPKPFDINSIVRTEDEKGRLLRELNAKFENRTFLPELKDVKRFFDRHGKENKNIKSRAASHGALFRYISTFDVTELKKIIATPAAKSEFSSLGLISDEILKNSNLKRNDETS